MTRNESRFLIVGLLAGVILAVYVGRLSSLLPLSKSKPAPAAEAPVESHVAAPSEAENPMVLLTDEEQKAIGLQTSEVVRQTLKKEVLTSGRIEEPETGITTISARVGGRIDRLLLNVTGESVKRGQAIAVIYSPEIFSSAEEFRLALEARQRLSSSREEAAIQSADELVRASRRRLELWGLTPEQIEAAATSPESAVHITLFSTTEGIVTKRHVAEGQYVKEGDVLYTLADLSSVWVQADIFESDIPMIRAGQIATLTSSALRGGTVRGTVSFLQPAVDPQTRTMTARIQIPNPQARLRPGMFVRVSIEIPLGTGVLTVPRSAVLDTGKEKAVYVAKGNGVFEKRSIDTSGTGDDYYVVTKGLDAGERVVTHGNFMIDSQTRISGSITGMYGGSKAFGTEPSSQAAITFRVDPTPPKGGEDGRFHVTVNGPDGQPISDAEVQATLVMPAMPSMGMAESRSSYKLVWSGSEYTGTGKIPVAGPWNVTVEVRRGGTVIGVFRTRFDAH